MTRRTDKEVVGLMQESVIWHDVMTVVETMAERPLYLTVNKNLTRKEINHFGSIFRHDIYHRDKNGKILWPISTETECRYLLKVRALIQVMSLGRNYKRTYRITKNGRDFLQGDMFGQFVSLWTAFITVYNWEYIHPAWGNKKRIAVVLQENFPGIAQMMLAETGWVEMKAFAKQVALKFDLSEDARDVPYGISFVRDDIERILIEELRMFNLVEVETESDKYDSKRIRRFRVNRLGRETLTLLPSPAELTDMPKAISVTMIYQGELQLLLNKESESIIASAGMTFLFLLKMWFDSYPQVAAQYPPGTLGLSLNGNPPTDFDSLGEGDVVTITVAKKRKWVN